MSLPAIFQTTLEKFPAEVPYLFADLRRVMLWRDRLESLPGLKIGISWQGNPRTRTTTGARSRWRCSSQSPSPSVERMAVELSGFCKDGRSGGR
jgi:hypothetical protein